jgi:hypothetical protein
MKSLKLFALFVLLTGTLLATTTGTELFIPAAAKATGSGGTDWRTDLRLYNPNTAAVDVTVYYLPRTNYAGDAASQVIHLEALQIQMTENILLNLFAITGNTAGAFRITAPLAIMAESRTWTPGAAGTYGQRIPGIPKAQAIAAGFASDLLYADNSGAPSVSGFRTNAGFVDTTGTGSTITVTAFMPDGTIAGTPMNIALAAYEPRQLDAVLSQLGVSGEAMNYRVNVLVNTGAVIPYASQVDNISGDPIYVDGAVAKTGGGGTGSCGTAAVYGNFTQTDNGNWYGSLCGALIFHIQDGALIGWQDYDLSNPDDFDWNTALNYITPGNQVFGLTIDLNDTLFAPPLDLPDGTEVPFTFDVSYSDSTGKVFYTGAYEFAITRTCNYVTGTANAIVVAKVSDYKDIAGKFYWKFDGGIK